MKINAEKLFQEFKDFALQVTLSLVLTLLVTYFTDVVPTILVFNGFLMGTMAGKALANSLE